jgi:Protein of unknown function (DUF1580)
VIDRTRERLIPIARVAEHGQLWPEGRAPHPETIARWARRGCRGIRLETVVLGGRRYSSIEAVERFFSRLSGE